MSEPVTWAAVGMAAVSNIATWLMVIRGNRPPNNSKKNNSKPGLAVECQKRGVQIAVMETKQSGYEKDAKEIKDDLKYIRKAINK